MAGILAYFKILRPVNLVIILVSQYVIQFHVISPVVEGKTVLNPLLWALFSLTTMIIAGSGYVINDICDVTTDKVNKPGKNFIPDTISFQNATIYYVALVSTGFILALYIAFRINFESHIWIYPLAAGTLYAYARQLKSTVLTGNIVVSLFVGLVWGILFYIQGTHESLDADLLNMGYAFSFLGFISNFMREIIKDVEDLEGDKKSGIRTLPSVLGLSVAKRIIFSLGFVFILFLIYALLFWKNTFEWTMYIFFIMSFVVGIMNKTVRAHKKSDYTDISRHLKVLMVLGLLGVYLASRL